MSKKLINILFSQSWKKCQHGISYQRVSLPWDTSAELKHGSNNSNVAGIKINLHVDAQRLQLNNSTALFRVEVATMLERHYILGLLVLTCL